MRAEQLLSGDGQSADRSRKPPRSVVNLRHGATRALLHRVPSRGEEMLPVRHPARDGPYPDEESPGRTDHLQESTGVSWGDFYA